MKTVIIYSGGMDSTVLLHDLLNQGDTVLAMGVNYGQRHKKELRYAALNCDALGVEFRVADLSAMKKFMAGSSQTDMTVPVPHGHYAEENMKKTVVPFRNGLMLSAATAWAISEKADRVAYAAHKGDLTVYPDCREEFASAFNTVMLLGDWHQPTLHRPYVRLTKREIAGRGRLLDVDFSNTWSCYEGGDVHCGLCGTCTERRYALLGVDPTKYDPAGLAELPDDKLTP